MLRTTTLILSVLLILLIGCSSGPGTREVKQYTIEQFFDTVSIGGGSFSPDEKTLLYSSDASGVYNAYSIPVSGGEPTALTQSTDTTFAISYFPHDERILLRRDQGGNEIYHIYLREGDGTVTDLTPGEKNRALFQGWAHDLNSFFYVSNNRDPQFMDLYEMEIENLTSKLIYKNADGHSIGPISHDKRYLALSKEVTNNDNDIYLQDLETGQRKHLSPHEGDAQFAAMDFSPDGKSLYCGSNIDSEFQYLAKMDLESAESEVIFQPEWDVMYGGLSWSGKYLYAGVNADAQTQIKVFDTATMQPVELPQLPEGQIERVAFSRGENLLRFYLSSPRSSSDLYVYDLSARKHTRLTDTMNPEINPEDLAGIEVVRYKSFDGLEIPALLMKPHLAAGEKVPGIIQVHGGPGGQTRIDYNPVHQYLVNHGYAILMVNNRGSSGYGKTFYSLDDHKHGQDDLMDCVEGKEYLISTGFVDPEKVGILGGSYGGYMVLAALAFQPDAFDVGVDIFGVANWVRTLKSIPPWWTAARDSLYAELGNPETEEEYLRKISPLFHAENITKPLIVLQGANDPRVLQIESDEIVENVRKNGVPVEYIVFDDEGHGFTKKANRIKGYRAIREFLDNYLKGAPSVAQAQ
jgi:dipeptidyl aminopeptidase/acylaminoacyl peptidase